MAKVKITVIKKLNYKDLFGDNPPCALNDESIFEPECSLLSVGQEFIISGADSYPTGFCAWAFTHISNDIVHLFFGGDYSEFKNKRVVISCCTDGLRPVIFKLERIED